MTHVFVIAFQSDGFALNCSNRFSGSTLAYDGLNLCEGKFPGSFFTLRLR